MKLASLLLLANLSASALQAEPEKSPASVVKEYFEDLQTGKFSELMDLFADDIVWHQPGRNILSKTYVGKQQVGSLFQNFMEISVGSFKIDQVFNIMANGKLVSATLHFNAAKNKNAEALSISMNGVDVMRVEHGKIKEVFLFSANQTDEDNFWGTLRP